MQQSIPYKRIVRIALLTTPLFAIFGVMPMPIVMIGRLSWHEVLYVFLSIIITVIFFWAINIAIFSIFEKKRWKHTWLKYIVSIIICVFVGMFVLDNTNRREFQEFRKDRSELPFQRDGFERRPHFQPPHFNNEPFKKPPFGSPFRFVRILPLLSMNVIIMVLLEMIILRTRKERIERENSLLRISNIEAKNSLLQQQLQPHFLFNSLSVLKSLVIKNTSQANNYIDKLSNLLRYSLYSNNGLTVSCAEELSYAGDYLEMQKIRFGNTMNYNISVPAPLLSKKLPVFTIQPLVENALKHNVFNEQAPIFITITGDEANQLIIVKNNIRIKTKNKSDKGLGLKNLRERYALLGGESLTVNEDENYFTVSLKLLDNESHYHRG